MLLKTTLTDRKLYSGDELSELDYRRWHVELDRNSLKTMMGLDVLRGKTPHMLRLEFLVGILAYNLVRLRIASVGSLSGVPPREIGFTAGLTWVSMNWVLALHRCDMKMQREELLELSKQRIAIEQGGWSHEP